MQVKLMRRWGPHRAPKTVEVSDSQGRWLVQHNYAESTSDVFAPEQEAAAPGGNGPDPLAGGDATRRRPRITRPERDAQRNYARSAENAPPAAYRAGFGPEDRKREGEAGKVATALAAEQEQQSTASAADSEDEGTKKPARRRSSRSES